MPHISQTTDFQPLPSPVIGMPVEPDSRLAYDVNNRGLWSETVQRHNELLSSLPGVEALAEAALPVEPGRPLVFEKQGGEITSVLPFDFAAHGLPSPPDGENPLAVVVFNDPDRNLVKTVQLFTDRLTSSNGGLSRYYLEHPNLPADADAISPHWVNPGDAYRSVAGAEAQIVRQTDTATTISFVDGGYGSQDTQQAINVFRADTTPLESRLESVEQTDKRAQRLIKARRWLAGLVLASGLAGAAYHAESTSPDAPSYTGYVGDPAAVRTLQANLSLFESGNTRQLKAIAEKSGFEGKSPIDFKTLKQIDTATSVKQVESIMATSLKPLHIGFQVRHQVQHRDYDGGQVVYDKVSDTDVEQTKQTALGILDGINELNTIVTKGAMFDVEIVGHIKDSSVSFDPAGNYEHGDDQATPLIRIAVQDKSGVARDNFEHEEGHHENITDNGIGYGFDSINANWLEYGPDGSGNGVDGRDIVSTYAGTSTEEDAAEMMQYLFGSNRAINPEQHTILQQKLLYVMASLESEYPGSSAAILQYAKKAKVSPDEQVVSGFNRVRSHAREVFVVSALMELGVALALADTRKRQKDQEIVGLRNGVAI